MSRLSTAALAAFALIGLPLLAACGPADAMQSEPLPATGSPAAQTGGEISLAQAPATDNRASPAPDLRQVRVAEASSGAITTSRTTSVTIEPGREARVAAGTSGQVEAIVVREGSNVQAGDPVIRLDDRNLRLQVQNATLALETAQVNLEAARRASGEGAGQAQAALQAAQSNLDLARRQYQEAQQLYQAGGIAATELAGLEAQLAQAQSNYQQAQDALARSQRAGSEDLELRRLQVAQAQNQLAQARSALDEAVVTAPFAGSIASLMVEEGEFIGAGSPAFRLVSNEQQQARFSVPPQDAQALLSQGLIHIPYNGLSYAAQITNSSDVPGDSRLVELTATIYPSQSRIPNGTVAQLNYTLTLAEGVVVPVAAVGTSQGQSYVMLVEEGETVRSDVEVLAESAGEVVVEGLAPGSIVVSPLPADLLSGIGVQIIGEANTR